MPHDTPAWHQLEQETLEALDSLLGAAQGYRASVAAGQPSVAVAQQLLADAARVVSRTGQMTGMASAVHVVRAEIAARGERAA
jgi:hypothetical protein